MIVKFPFKIAQVSDSSVEVILDGPTPLLDICIHQDYRHLISDEALDRIYEYAMIAVVKETITITA